MNFSLGKSEYVHDERTLRLARYVLPEIHVPARYDFDKMRAPFPIHTWGNNEWGDCVIAGQANNLLRLERVEQRQTLHLTDEEVVARYKALTGAQKPGDAHDTGLYVIDGMRNWRNFGFQVGKRNFTIAAYGELEPGDKDQLRTACYLFHGIHVGLWLPLSAQGMIETGVWDYQGETGSEWRTGSWGGHLVYCKAYDPSSLEVLSWGQKITVTNAFIDKYCDEAWAVVDNLDSWRTKQTIDVIGLTAQLSQISHKVNA